MADGESSRAEGVVMLRERVSASDMESGHFATNLLERINWAIGDAQAAELERRQRPADRSAATEQVPVPT
jgi:hypothetical protein